MFCSECGKIIKEGSKFCKYCGGSQKNSSVESQSVITNFSVSDYENARRKNMEFIDKTKTVIIGAVIVIAVVWILGNYHECDWCQKKFVGTAYYDSFDADTIMCEDCAKKYYKGIGYTRFQVQ